MTTLPRWLRRIGLGISYAVGGALCVAFVVKDPSTDFLPHWGSPVGVTMLLGIALIAVTLAGAIVTGDFSRRDPLAGLTRRERRSRLDQVRRHNGNPVPANDLPLLRQVAAYMRVSRWNYVGAPGLLLTFVPALTLAPGDWLFPHWKPVYILFLAAVLLQSSVHADGRPGDDARAHSFLKTHGAPGTSPAGPSAEPPELQDGAGLHA